MTNNRKDINLEFSLPSTARCSLMEIHFYLEYPYKFPPEVWSAVMGGLGNHRNRIWIFTWHWPEWLARSVDFCPPTVVQTIFANASASMYNLYLWSSLKTSASMYLNIPSDTPGEYHSKKFGSLDKNGVLRLFLTVECVGQRKCHRVLHFQDTLLIIQKAWDKFRMSYWNSLHHLLGAFTEKFDFISLFLNRNQQPTYTHWPCFFVPEHWHRASSSLSARHWWVASYSCELYRIIHHPSHHPSPSEWEGIHSQSISDLVWVGHRRRRQQQQKALIG